MRRPRLRFTVRWMLVAIAAISVVCLAGREYWTTWAHRIHPNLVYPSRLTASAGTKHRLSMVPGESIPVSIRYDFRFRNPRPGTGTTCLLLAQVWFEDSQTGTAVEGYSFDAALTVGGRESTSGSFVWDAVLHHPGRYALRYMLYYQDLQGRFHGFSGGSRSYQVVAAEPLNSVPGGEAGKR